MKSKINSNQLKIGWKEWISLPGLEVPAIKTKLDTGARTSVLHTSFIESFSKSGKDMVKFDVHPLQRKNNITLHCIAPVHDVRKIRDSGGREEERYIILTDIKLGMEQWKIELSLTNRNNMKFRMLLGRSAVQNRNILINPDACYLTGKYLGRIYRKTDRKKS